MLKLEYYIIYFRDDYSDLSWINVYSRYIDDFDTNLFFNGIMTRRPHYYLRFIYRCIRVACRGRTGYHENNFEDWDGLKINLQCSLHVHHAFASSARSLSFG